MQKSKEIVFIQSMFTIMTLTITHPKSSEAS